MSDKVCSYRIKDKLDIHTFQMKSVFNDRILCDNLICPNINTRVYSINGDSPFFGVCRVDGLEGFTAEDVNSFIRIIIVKEINYKQNSCVY